VTTPSIPEPVDLAYAAGFIDGEGSIIIARRRIKGRHDIHLPMIDVTQNDPSVLYWLRDLFGAGYIGKRPEAKIHSFRIANRAAIDTARLLLPYLKVKQEQAKILIAFKDDALWRRGGNKSVPPHEHQRREELTDRMGKLNSG
jgi:hypothetical protein